jgi:hypothetical protein
VGNLGPGGATRGGSNPPARTPPLTCASMVMTSARPGLLGARLRPCRPRAGRAQPPRCAPPPPGPGTVAGGAGGQGAGRTARPCWLAVHCGTILRQPTDGGVGASLGIHARRFLVPHQDDDIARRKPDAAMSACIVKNSDAVRFPQVQQAVLVTELQVAWRGTARPYNRCWQRLAWRSWAFLRRWSAMLRRATPSPHRVGRP